MDKDKIDQAVTLMLQLTPEERAVVNYTVEREGKRRKRRAKVDLGQLVLGR